MPIDLAGTFLAGLLTFASPCILPLVPLYLGLLGGASVEEVRSGARSRRVVARTGAFVAGLATVFVALGLVASAAGRLLAEHRGVLLVVAGIAMATLGLHHLGVLRLPALERERRPWLARVAPGGSLLAAFVFGGAFALGWTPCIGPVLGSVLTYTASAGASSVRGALYLGVYAAGIGAPLLAAAAAAPRVLGVLDRLRPHLRKLEIATGLVLVATGVLVATDRLALLVPADAVAAPAPVATAATPPAAAFVLPAPAAACTSATAEGNSACALPAATSAAAPAPLELATVRGPAVLEVMSRSCPVCKLMEPVVAEAERGCASRVTRVFIEDPAGAALARRYAIRGVPTFVAVDASGDEVTRLVGSQTAEAVRAALELASPRVCDRAIPSGSAPAGS